MENFTLPEVTADDHVLGPAAAPVTVLEYGDYECPFCRGAYRDVHRMLDLYPGSIRFVFRNFPIQQLHPHAEQAAEAAEAAAAQGKFWEMYELLLRPSSRLDFDSLVALALDLGLDRSAREAAEAEGVGQADPQPRTGVAVRKLLAHLLADVGRGALAVVAADQQGRDQGLVAGA